MPISVLYLQLALNRPIAVDQPQIRNLYNLAEHPHPAQLFAIHVPIIIGLPA